jgi:hypothetical protein
MLPYLLRFYNRDTETSIYFLNQYNIRHFIEGILDVLPNLLYLQFCQVVHPVFSPGIKSLNFVVKITL